MSHFRCVVYQIHVRCGDILDIRWHHYMLLVRLGLRVFWILNKANKHLFLIDYYQWAENFVFKFMRYLSTYFDTKPRKDMNATFHNLPFHILSFPNVAYASIHCLPNRSKFVRQKCHIRMSRRDLHTSNVTVKSTENNLIRSTFLNVLLGFWLIRSTVSVGISHYLSYQSGHTACHRLCP